MRLYSTFWDGERAMNDKTRQTHEVAIEVEALEVGYEGRTILQNVNFTVKRGEIFFVIGGSGCGKSTLLRHMVGLRAPTAGRPWTPLWGRWRKAPSASRASRSQRPEPPSSRKRAGAK